MIIEYSTMYKKLSFFMFTLDKIYFLWPDGMLKKKANYSYYWDR